MAFSYKQKTDLFFFSKTWSNRTVAMAFGYMSLMFICIFHYCWLYLFIEVVMLYLFIEVVRLCPSGFVVSREWSRVAYVLPECWFISIPANFRWSICPLFSKGHAKIFREFRHDLCYKLGHIECPRFAAPRRSQRSCKA